MRILNITILSNLALKYLNLRAPQICCLLIRNYVAAILSLLSVSQCSVHWVCVRPSYRLPSALYAFGKCATETSFEHLPTGNVAVSSPVYSFFNRTHHLADFFGKLEGIRPNTDLPLVDKLHRRLIGHNWFLTATPSEEQTEATR